MSQAARRAFACTVVLFLISLVVKGALLVSTGDSGLFTWREATPLFPLAAVGSDLLASIAVGLLIWSAQRALERWAVKERKARVIVGTVMVLAAIVLWADYYIFQIAGAPFNPAMAQAVGDIGNFLSSAYDFVTPYSVSFLLVLVAIAVLLPRRLAPYVERWVRRPKPWILVGLLVAGTLATAGEVLGRRRRTESLERNGWAELFFPRSGSLPREGRKRSGRGPVHFDMRSITAADLLQSHVTSGTGDAAQAARGTVVEDWSKFSGVARGSNLLHVVLESTGARYLKLYGAADDPTPRMTQLAAHGLVFDDFYSLSPASMKALVTTFCSTFPYPAARAETYVNPQLPCHSLPEILTAGGYQAALFHSGEFSYTHKDRFFVKRGFDPMYDANNMPNSLGAYKNSWGIDERTTVRAMLDWLKTQRDASKPFFLAYVPVFPHHPYDVPEEKYVRYGKETPLARYRNSLHYVDDSLAELLDGMKRLGVLDNTLIVIHGDHGEAFEQHPNVRGHAIALYDENVRVPLVISHRGFETMQHVRTLGGLPDVTPTILDLLGLPRDERHQGQSLLRMHEPRFLPMFTDLAYSVMAVRDGPWKYIVNLTKDRQELFDLARDPDEQTNRIRAYPELAAQLAKRLREWADFQSDLILNYQERVGDGQRKSTRANFLNQIPPSKVEYDRRSPRLHGSTAGKGSSVVSGKKYTNVIGMLPKSSLGYQLNKQYKRLEGEVGRDARGADGAVAGRVLVDGKVVFDSGPLSRETPPVKIKVSVQNAQEVELQAYDPDGNAAGDNLNWLIMRLK